METYEYIEVVRHNLGRRIRRLRREQGMSQERFAAMIGMHRTYLSSVENGNRNVSLNSLARISHGLGMPISALFSTIDIEMQDEPSPHHEHSL